MKHEKKILTLSIIALTAILITLVFYNINTTKATPITYGLSKITYEELTTKKENQEDFILIVSRSNCSHCATYKPKVEEIAIKNEIIVYYIDTDTLSNKDDFLEEFNLDGATPMTLFFKDGKETTVLNRIEGDLSSKTVKEKFKDMGFIDW